MTIPQFIVAYAVCWWLVLFMLLPSGAAPAAKPGLGHAPSAPANPGLKRKFRLTTLYAFLPTLLIYLVATTAKADDGMYHVGSGCAPLAVYAPSDDVAVRDGYGTGDHSVASANLESSSVLGEMDSVKIPLKIPVENYMNASDYNADLSQSFASVGEVEITQHGEAQLNGKSMAGAAVMPEKCATKAAGK